MEEQNLDYRLIIIDFFESYKQEHTKEKTFKVITKMLQKENIYFIPKMMKSIDKTVLSNELKKIIIESALSNETYRKAIKPLIPILFKKNRNIKTRKLKINAKLLKRISIITTVLAVSYGSCNYFNEEYLSDEYLSEENNLNNGKVASDAAINNINISLNLDNISISPIKSYTVNSNNKNIQKINIKKKSNKKIETRKEKILYKFKEYKTVDSILERQKELESLNLTKKDKLYKNCKLSAPVQWFIYEQSVINKWAPDFTFAIIYTETRGGFDSSGEVSYNGTSDDIGLTQQNTKSSLKMFCNKYKLTYVNDLKDLRETKAYKLVKDNDYVNIVSCFEEYKEIARLAGKKDMQNCAGYYNGWAGWKNKEISRQYVKLFSKAYDNIYTSYHEIISKEETKEEKKNGVKSLTKHK